MADTQLIERRRAVRATLEHAMVPGQDDGGRPLGFLNAISRRTGLAELVVQTMTYAPGQTSGWHSHPGLHLVCVISGTLTVYGPDCRPRSHGPGEPYIGGDRVHLARNEGDVAVEMGVTHLSAPGRSMAHFRVAHPGPASCPVQ